MKTKYHLGMSLTEIMIALVISSILMYGVVTIMVSSKRTYALQDELAKLQDNARFIMEDITFALRMAGYQGCSANNSGASVEGENNSVIRDDGNNRLGEEFPLSDTLTIYSIGTPLQWRPEDEVNYSPEHLSANPIILHPDSLLPNVGDIVTVSDCRTKANYPVAAVNNTVPSLDLAGLGNIVFQRPIDIFLQKDSTLTYRVQAYYYQAGGGGRSTIGFALYKNDQRFIDGVENLQVRYGVLGPEGVLYQETPPTNTNESLISVRVTLLMRTAQPRFDLEGAMDKEYILDNPEIKYNPTNNLGWEAGFRHRLFTTVVSIRNANLNRI